MHQHQTTIVAGLRLVCYSALCGALLLAAGCSERRSEQYRGEGDTLVELGRLEEARAAYTRSETANPENPMAQVGLARIAVKSGELEKALSLYAKARELSPSLAEAYMEPVRALVEAARFEDALALGESFAQLSPEKGGLLHGAVLLKADRAADAVVHLEALRERFPDSPEVQLNLGVAYAESGRPVDAAAVLDPLVGGGSDIDSSAQMALIEVYDSQGRIAELVPKFEALADGAPANTNIQLSYARVLLLADRPVDAEGIARKVLEKDPASGWANYIVGMVKLDQGAKEEAMAFLNGAATALPDEKEIVRVLAQATGQLPADGSAPGGSDTSGGASATRITWKDLWKQAALVRLVGNRDVYLAEGGDEAREVLVLAALFTQRKDLAVELAAVLPDASPIRQFINAMESRDANTIGDFFKGWNPEETERLQMRDNALGFAMASGGSRGQALSLYLFCLERWPDHGVALFNIAQVFRALRQPVIAAQQFQRLTVQYPDNIDAHQMLYAALREGGAYDEARSAAEASFTLFPEEKWTFLYLSQAYLDTKDPELALQVLSRATGMFPGDPELELVMGGIYARLGDCGQVKAVLEGIKSTAPGVVADRANLLALCAMQAGAWDEVRVLADSADPSKSSDSLRLLNAIARLKGGDADAARAALLAPGSEVPIAGKLGLMLTSALGVAVEGLREDEQAWAAELGADHGLLEAYGAATALQMAKLYGASWDYHQAHLANRTPHIAIVRLGLTALQFGDDDEGIEEKGLALVQPLSEDPRAWLGLAELRHSLGNAEGEAEALSKAVETGPANPEVWFRYGALLEKKQNYAGAAESYRKLVELQPESAAANNNLAYMLLMAGGKDKEALEKAAFAKEKVPNNPAILHTLGLAQMRTGDLEASKASLNLASELDPANPTISFDFGRALLQLGDKDKAKERVRYALGMSRRAGLDFPEAADAERLLQEMD